VHSAYRTLAVGLLSALWATSALASPISLTTKLVGDPRPDSPDNLTVVVSIQGDTDSNVTNWTVDLDMASYYPQARLDEFAFNLVGPGSKYTFSNFNLPYTPVTGSMNGSGNTNFMLTLDDPTGNKYDATNVYSLSFTLTKSTGSFELSDFYNAWPSCLNDAFLGCNQLAAHLQAVGPDGQDSGIAVGNYPGSPVNPVPEPGTMLLLGSGMAASAIAKRRRRNAAALSM